MTQNEKEWLVLKLCNLWTSFGLLNFVSGVYL
jgi:hypothetical protein